MDMHNVLRVVTGTLLSLSVAVLVPAAGAASPSASAGYPNTAYLGVHIDDITAEHAGTLKLKDASGVLITDLDRDGPACKAGLKENDVIVAFNGTKITNTSELAEVIHATPAGKTVDVEIIRDGQAKNVQVTLGNTAVIADRTMSSERHRMAMLPPVPYVGPVPPDIDVPSFTQLSTNQGMIVESLTPQLGDYFGVPSGQGVLVRSVRKGSAAAVAGLRAGDVIVKINNEVVHDIADWRRSLLHKAGKMTVNIVRDKREQTVELTLPGPSDNSKLQDYHWEWFDKEAFEKGMQSWREEMEKLRPQLEQSQREMLATIQPNRQALEQMQREMQKSLTLHQQDIERLTRELRESLPSQEQIARMQGEIAKSVPTQKQMDEIRRQVEESMKSWTPQLQQQMDQLKKQMERQRLNLEDILRDPESEREF